jgi:hypothetical protein
MSSSNLSFRERRFIDFFCLILSKTEFLAKDPILPESLREITEGATEPQNMDLSAKDKT